VDTAVRAISDTPLPPREGTGRRAAPKIEVLTEFNPEKRTAVQVVPGLIGVILSMTMVIFTAIALVRERERGNLELLITTPVRSVELMVGKLAPYILVGLVQTTLVLLAGILLFTVPIVGSLLDLYLGAGLFIAATLGLGLVISTVAATQFQAMQLGFFTLLPSIVLSGFAFPFEGSPRSVQWIAQVLPLTHFVEILRGVILRGATLGALWLPVVKLSVFLVLAVGLAAARFHKRLD
jgi:ABC-2 type transport system permease protein